MEKRSFLVGGMSCAACSARVERAVSELSGVDLCQVNLLANSMTVVGEISDEEIIAQFAEADFEQSAFERFVSPFQLPKIDRGGY